MHLKRDCVMNECVSDPQLDVLNFLNEVTFEFPRAISFAAGRLPGASLQLDCHLEALVGSIEDTARSREASPDRLWQELGQYSRTSGIITDAIAAHLALDEAIHVAPDAIIVTVGAQEAMAIVLTALFEPRRDVLLVSDPTYVGITGLARLLGIRVAPVPAGDGGLDPETVESVIDRTSREGRVRALYDIPNFNNPLGTSLSLANRIALIDVCRRHDVLLIEDNPYGMFAYDHPRPPTLKALDEDGSVLYIGSFSKTLLPGLRVGYLVADQRVAGSGVTLAHALSRVKSLLTVNTPPLSQAIVADALRRTGGTLEPIVAPKREACRRNRDAMLRALDEHCPPGEEAASWNRPPGGFFLTLTLPGEFGAAQLRQCAAEYDVIVSPMQFFCVGANRRRQIRLAFSSTTPEQIHTGIGRLARYVRERMRSEVPARECDTPVP